MSQPTPPSMPPAPQTDVEHKPGAEPPIDIRRATNFYTTVAAFLVFLAVTSLMTMSSSVVETRRALHEADAELSAQISNGMIQTLLVLSAAATIAVAIGHGLTAHALRERKSWARPLGFTFSGIVLGLAVLNVLGGAISFQVFFFVIAGMAGISLMGRPAVRDYLKKPPPMRPYPPIPPFGPGDQPPYGNRPPHGNQPPHGDQRPFGEQPERGDEQSNGAYRPRHAEPPSGDNPQN